MVTGKAAISIPDTKAALAPVFEKQAGCLVAAYLFGSHATGSAGPLSDFDLAFLLSPECYHKGVDLRLELYADCSRALRRNDLDIVLMNPTRNLFLLEEIVNRGIILFDAAPDFRHEFEAKVLHDFIDFRDQRRKVMGI